MKHLDVILTGKVQGVGLRYQIKGYAEDVGLFGYARNLRDGSVCLELEGEDLSLDKFLVWLKSGPGLSEVKSSDINEGEIKSYQDFQVF